MLAVLTGCQPETRVVEMPVEVEVTRVVEMPVEVEVSRVVEMPVEVEVTRIVERIATRAGDNELPMPATITLERA